MKPQDIICFLALIVVTLVVFMLGYHAGNSDIRRLKNAGYKIVKHEVHHGEFMTNWIEVIKNGDVK